MNFTYFCCLIITLKEKGIFILKLQLWWTTNKLVQVMHFCLQIKMFVLSVITMYKCISMSHLNPLQWGSNADFLLIVYHTKHHKSTSSNLITKQVPNKTNIMSNIWVHALWKILKQLMSQKLKIHMDYTRKTTTEEY